MTSPVLSGLIKKREELAVEITKYERDINSTRIALRAVDASIRLYDPDYQPASSIGKVRRSTPNRWFAMGECIELIQDTLREWDGAEPPTTNDFVYALAAIKQVDYDNVDDNSRRGFYKSVFRSLRHGEKRGWIAEDFRRHGLIFWRHVSDYRVENLTQYETGTP